MLLLDKCSRNKCKEQSWRAAMLKPGAGGAPRAVGCCDGPGSPSAAWPAPAPAASYSPSSCCSLQVLLNFSFFLFKGIETVYTPPATWLFAFQHPIARVGGSGCDITSVLVMENKRIQSSAGIWPASAKSVAGLRVEPQVFELPIQAWLITQPC